MPLSGVNKKCQQCTQECKQWKQIKVIECPFFDAIPKNPVTIKHEEMEKMPLSAYKQG